LDGPVVVVLEGKARSGASSGTADGVTVVHAEGSGDDALVGVVRDAAGSGHRADAVVLVTADRELRGRAEAVGAEVVGPKWLWEHLD
jgi:rRNA-processing protein FCF1